ncbi:MAG: M48 family metalloprotease [Gammaproteobacteria bacterium]|nr:M48 family metalloprotease [Gammaproteobacteria bacterium]
MRHPIRLLRRRLSMRSSRAVAAAWAATALFVIAPAAPPAAAQTVRDLLRQTTPDSLRLALALSDADEIRAGQMATANLLGVAPLVHDEELQRYVNRVGRWIALGSKRPDLPWHFGVIESADVNAFAAPGGYVLITRGLYASLGDEAELAGVIAHEIAHIAERHQIELMRKSLLLERGAKALEGELAGDKQKEELLRRHVGTGAEMFARRLDQGAEFEADRHGVILAARAGYSPFGLPAVLQKIASVPRSDDRVSLLYATHPAPEQRLRQLDAMSESLYRYDGAAGELYPLR